MRYHHALPPFLADHLPAVTLGEGWTKAVPCAPDDAGLLVKMDHLMPTMSFKDRGAVLLIGVRPEPLTAVMDESLTNLLMHTLQSKL